MLYMYFSIYSLPKSVKRRIKALKKLQFDSSKIEGDFYKEVHELECKYAAKYTPLFEKVKLTCSHGYMSNTQCSQHMTYTFKKKNPFIYGVYSYSIN